MKIRSVILSAALCAVQSLAASDVLTIGQCYADAQANYPLTSQRGLIEQSRQYSISNAAKGWLPQVSVNAQATYQSDITRLPFDSNAFGKFFPDGKVPSMSKDQYKVYAEVSQTVWDGGAISAVRDVASAESALRQTQLESQLYGLRHTVNQLYFGCLLQDELIAQNMLLQKELQVNISRIEAMMANGVANQSDKECLQVEVLNARQRENELRASRKAYGAMLCALTGRDADSDITLTEPDNPAVVGGAVCRPELAAFDARRNVLDAQLRKVNSALNPKLGAFVQGGYGRPALNMFNDDFRPFYVIGVRFNWNIGKLYTLRNDRRQIANSYDMVSSERETFLLNTRLKLIQENAEIRKLSEQMESDAEITRLRVNIKNAAMVKLDNGVISVSDLIREINAEDMSRQNSLTHRVQYLKAVYDYLEASGRGWNGK